MFTKNKVKEALTRGVICGATLDGKLSVEVGNQKCAVIELTPVEVSDLKSKNHKIMKKLTHINSIREIF